MKLILMKMRRKITENPGKLLEPCGERVKISFIELAFWFSPCFTASFSGGDPLGLSLPNHGALGFSHIRHEL